jgi:hypothetical protein
MIPALIAWGCLAVIAVGIARHTNLLAPPRGPVAAVDYQRNPPIAPGGCLVIAYLNRFVKASHVPVFIGVLLNVSRQCGNLSAGHSTSIQ